MKKLSNIDVSEFRDALKSLGLQLERTRGGHESWWKEGLTRPVVFPNHINPMWEEVIKSNLRTLGITKEDFLKLLDTL